MISRIAQLATVVFATLLFTGCSFSLFNTLGLSSSQIDQEALEDVVSANPENAHAWFVLGREYYQQEDYSRARRAFERAVELQPNFTEAQLGVGLTRLEQENWRRAREAFESALEIESASARAYHGIAEAHFGAGDYAAAEEAAGHALLLEPEHAPALRIMGDIRYIEANYTEAARYWRASIQHGGDEKRLGPLLEDLERYLRHYQ